MAQVFRVEKNKYFTAIDTHTIHEKEIIQLRLNDTVQYELVLHKDDNWKIVG